MKIPAIDQGDVNGRALELLRGVQPGETPTQNHDLMSRSHIRSLPCEANSRNSTGDSLIFPEVRSTNWIHQGSTSLGLILCLTLALILLPANGLQACEDEPNSHSAKDSS